jgi:two-component system response regulator FixJ
MSEPIVHVVDDDAAMRDSVAFLLDSENIQSRTYADAKDLLALCPNLEAGCIVTDIRMPDINGLEMVLELKRRNVAHPVIVLTGHADVSLAVQAMKAGVTDFLEKPFRDEDLLSAVRTALRHGEDDAARGRERAETAARLAQLTARELEVFKLVARGLSNAEIAAELIVSETTVKTHVARMLMKLGLRDRVQAVVLAYEAGVAVPGRTGS